MPSINFNFIQNLLKDNKDLYPLFVETGTYLGETIRPMEPYFKNLYTIEISPLLHEQAKNLYRGNKIKFLLGDSSVVLTSLISELNDNTIFFLDGHWSSGITGRGFKDCPLVEEINTIFENFKHKAIIIVDDYSFFGKSPKTGNNENWEDISKDILIQILSNRLIKTYHLPSELDPTDRLIFEIDSIKEK